MKCSFATRTPGRPNHWLIGASVLGRWQAGVSLVEVLVAVVVLSIGLLGLAGLQASGIRVGQSSIYRSQAAQLAYDMVDRMRVNVASAGSYGIGLADATPGCAAAPTTSAAVAQCDLRDWRLRLLQALPSGTGAIDATAAPQVNIVIQWDDARGGGQQVSQFQITAQLAD